LKAYIEMEYPDGYGSDLPETILGFTEARGAKVLSFRVTDEAPRLSALEYLTKVLPDLVKAHPNLYSWMHDGAVKITIDGVVQPPGRGVLQDGDVLTFSKALQKKGFPAQLPYVAPAPTFSKDLCIPSPGPTTQEFLEKLPLDCPDIEDSIFHGRIRVNDKVVAPRADEPEYQLQIGDRITFSKKLQARDGLPPEIVVWYPTFNEQSLSE
jgi:hypothetical protein